jgi:uncharacterized protein YqeY
LLAPNELEAIVRDVVAALPAPAIGAVMSALRERYAGRFDGKQASEIAKRVIAGAS